MKREPHCFYNVAGLPSTQNADIDHLKQQRDNWPYSITQTAPWIWIWAASLSLLFIVLLNAWVCDDAYITFRTCFHLTQGHGSPSTTFRNVSKPIPIRCGCCCFHAFTSSRGRPISQPSECRFLSFWDLWLLHRRIFNGIWAGVMVVFLLGWSVSFCRIFDLRIGKCLEWVFAHAVLRGVLEGRGRTAEGIVAQPDCRVWYGESNGYRPALPAALVSLAWQMRSRSVVGPLLLGFLPFFLWEAFAIAYYGFPFPNTAYAKLNSGISQSEYWQHGYWYFLNCWQNDPLTLLTIVVGLALSLFRFFEETPAGLGDLFVCDLYRPHRRRLHRWALFLPSFSGICNLCWVAHSRRAGLHAGFGWDSF